MAHFRLIAHTLHVGGVEVVTSTTIREAGVARVIPSGDERGAAVGPRGDTVAKGAVRLQVVVGGHGGVLVEVIKASVADHVLGHAELDAFNSRAVDLTDCGGLFSGCTGALGVVANNNSLCKAGHGDGHCKRHE